MKVNLTIALLVCLFLSTIINIRADNNTTSQTTTLKQVKGENRHPNAPSRINIVCAYSDGYIEFTFPEGICSLSVHIYNEDNEWFGFVSKDYPSIVIPTFTGEFSIDCITDDGRIFSGTLLF